MRQYTCDGLPRAEDMSPLSPISDSVVDHNSPSMPLAGNGEQYELAIRIRGVTPEDSLQLELSPRPMNEENDIENAMPNMESPQIFQHHKIDEAYPAFPLDNNDDDVAWKFEPIGQQPGPQIRWEGPPHSNMSGGGISWGHENQLEFQPRQMPDPMLGPLYEGSFDGSSPPQAMGPPTVLSDHSENGEALPKRPHGTPYAQTKGWQNSIRHNLSMNHAFKKEDAPDESKKSSLWVLEDWAADGVQSTTRYRKNQRRSKSPKRLAKGSKKPRRAANDLLMRSPSPGGPVLAPAPGRLLAPSPSAVGRGLAAPPARLLSRQQQRQQHFRSENLSIAMHMQSLSFSEAPWSTQPMPSVAAMPSLPQMPNMTQMAPMPPTQQALISTASQQFPEVPTLLGHRHPTPQRPVFVRDMQRPGGQRPLASLVPAEQPVDGLFTDPDEAASYFGNNYTWGPDSNPFPYHPGYNNM
ncbi:hypothetical protein NPX13_g11041 [Xylaria arbuscula]|uniref:Fork-head domain-containing protein n=1 Tax=Xylaria arbuscula TaxID=114810 RepID=A0A9W8N3W7_9PEZI|nr:hypothetical protein NPX13_g11041 [Xylaria arbuscula]